VQLQIPRDGHWFVVIDHGGYKGRVRGADLEVLAPDELDAAPEPETALVEATAS
jgi:hypothetical protein